MSTVKSQVSATFDFSDTYVHLDDGPAATTLKGGDDFWANLESRTELQAGRLVCAVRSTEDWSTWEMHPAGDEIIYLLSGAMDLHLQDAAGERVIELRPGAACVVPRGIWHRAIVHAPSDALYITRGAGTQHRPV